MAAAGRGSTRRRHRHLPARLLRATARAIDGLEKALAGLGLLHDALALDLRKPQDYFHRVWNTAFLASDLAKAGGQDDDGAEYSGRVSRTFLYSNPEARTAVADAAAASGLRQPADLTAQGTEQEATWRQRALNAEDALKAAHAEILQQRTRLGELLGQVRDLQAEWTEGSIQRITTENTTLKQRVRQLTTDNRILDEQLKAARSNMRFQDRRLASLEAQLTSPPSPG